MAFSTDRVAAAVEAFNAEADRVQAAARELQTWWGENCGRFVTDPETVITAGAEGGHKFTAEAAAIHLKAVERAGIEATALIAAIRPTAGQHAGTLESELAETITGQVLEAVAAAQSLKASREKGATV